MARIYIGAGREAGARRQDLVGATTFEAGIAGRKVGAIDIADRFSLVEIAEDVAENVVVAVREAKIKGRKLKVCAERER
jgi:ATP-dependent RNA helicase DeaD